jgi:hypothetical protein
VAKVYHACVVECGERCPPPPPPPPPGQRGPPAPPLPPPPGPPPHVQFVSMDPDTLAVTVLATDDAGDPKRYD